MKFAADLAPVDILLLLASSEGDAPKVIELIAAGANLDTKVSNPNNPNTCRDFRRECPACRKQNFVCWVPVVLQDITRID